MRNFWTNTWRISYKTASWIVQGLLVAFLVAYIAFRAIDQRGLDLIDNLDIPLILGTLFLVHGATQRIEKQLSGGVPSQIKQYSDHNQFYRALRRAVEDANATVHTSYLRSYEPGALGREAERYFQSCVDWADGAQSRQLRRVLVKPADNQPGLQDWIDDQVRLADQRHWRNYKVRALDWRLNGPDAISVAIIDEEVVFFAFSGEADELRGFSVRSRELAKEYFGKYYDQLWEAGAPLPAGIVPRVGA